MNFIPHSWRVLLHVLCVLSLLLSLVPPGAVAAAPQQPVITRPERLLFFVRRQVEAEALRAARHEQRVAERSTALAAPVPAEQASWATRAEPALTASAPPFTATVFLPLVVHAFHPLQDVIITPETGGVVASPNGRLALAFPPGAVTAPTQVTIHPTGEAILPPRAVDRALFAGLEAQEVTGSAEVQRFSRPVQVTAQYDPATLHRTGGTESRLVLRARSGTGGEWYSLPSQVDTQAHTVSAPLLHFSEVGLFTTSPFSDVTPVQLAPFIPLTTSVGLGTFYTHTTVITYTEGEVWLSSTPDGQGELFSDDTVAITVTHANGQEKIYAYDYYDPISGTYTTTAPVELSALFAQGVNTVTIALADTRLASYGTYGYYLAQPRNPYGRLLGGDYPTAIALGRLDVASGNFMWRANDLAVTGLGPAVVFRRTYNSFDDSGSIFGAGWSSPFDSHVWQHFDGSVEVRRADGQRALFVPHGGGFAPEPGVFDRLEREGAGFILTEKRSLTEYHYDGDGQLWQISDRHGNQVDIAYSDDQIQVTDAAERVYTLELNGEYVAAISDPACAVCRCTTAMQKVA